MLFSHFQTTANGDIFIELNSEAPCGKNCNYQEKIKALSRVFVLPNCDLFVVCLKKKADDYHKTLLIG